MKISIITISFNNEKDIRETLESVLNQTYTNIEYIVVDGKSSDNTLQIINQYRSKISKIISETDKNLYDAINKGIHISTGDVIGMIHAGDRLFNNHVIEKIVNHFSHNDIDITYGNSKIVNKNDKSVRINISPEFNRSLVRSGWMPSQQSIYVRKELFAKFGLYRTDLEGIADYEWFIRYFYVNKLKIKLLNEYIIRFSLGGISTKNYFTKLNKKHFNQSKQCWLLNGLKPPIGIVYLQWLRKPLQFIRALFDNQK